MAELVELGTDPVNSVEREMIALLAEELPDVHYVIPNVSLSQGSGRHPYEYDAIVVASHAIYVVEIKGWYGDIREINRGEWQLSSGRYEKNPLLLNDQKAKVLASVMNRLDDLFDAHGNRIKRPYIHSCLLVGSDHTTFHVSDDAERCLTPSDIADYFRDPSRLPMSSHNAEDARNKYKHLTKKIAKFIAGKVDARESGPRTFGNYQVDKPIEQDQDTAVFIAKHSQFDDGRIYRLRTWYLSSYQYSKEERAEKEQTLRRSAEALNALGDHRNIVTLREYGENDGTFFEVTDWSDTGSLGTLISLGKNKTMTTERKLRIMRGVLNGLAAAIKNGIFHRNLNPEAILIGADGAPRIGMFDRAFMLQSEHTVYQDTADLRAPDYLAPEIRNTSDYDVFDNTDLYSFGVITFELFTSYVPSMLGHSNEKMTEMIRSSAGVEDEIVDDLIHFIFRCQANAPEDRMASVEKALEAVEEMLRKLRHDEAEVQVDAEEESAPEKSAANENHRRGVFEVGDRIDGSNVVKGILGAGAHSHVYRVENEIHGAEFALKIVDATCEDPNAPIREFGLLRDNGHPRIVHAVWAGRHQMPDSPSPAYILLDLIEGTRLDEWLESNELDEADTIAWTLDLLDALSALHPVSGDDPGAGIIHRDVKPANILVTESGPILFDFSSACFVDDAGEAPVGTLRFTPPDLNEAGWDPSADTFAVGCIIFEMLTGEPPWKKGAPSGEVPESVKTLRPEIATSVARVIDKAISPTRDFRYSSAVEFAEDLRASVKQKAVKPQPTSYAAAKLEGACRDIWSHDFIESLLSTENLLSTLYQTIREVVHASAPEDLSELETEFILREAHMMALEEPLYESIPSVYDELLEYHAPRTLDGTTLEPPSDGDHLLFLEQITHLDTAYLVETLEGSRELSQFYWVSGPTDPLQRTESEEALRDFVSHSADTITAGELSELSNLADRPVRWRLPAGNRGDAGLSKLLLRRSEELMGLANELAAFDGRVYIIATSACVYLGHGLRHDVGAAMPDGDRIRQTWAAAFGHNRVGRGDVSLSADIARPLRKANGRHFPIGRLAWPDHSDAPRLFSGGMSISERLLPILVLEPKS